MELDVGLLGAFIGGILSFASPCVLPLIPPYLTFLAGLSLEELSVERPSGAQSRRVLLAALVFVAGFTLVFAAMGATASFTGKLLALYARPLSFMAGAIIAIMGLHFMGVFRIALLYREARVHLAKKPPGLFGAFIIGLAFAFGWTPCVGPVLAALLFVAGAEDTLLQGVALLTAYALGIGVPFVLAAAFAGPFMRWMARFRKHIGLVEKMMGVLLVLTGILFMTGSINEIGYWLLETFPRLGQQG